MSKLLKHLSLGLGLMGFFLINTAATDCLAQGTVINGIYLPEEMCEKVREYVDNISDLSAETKITRQDVAKALGFGWPIPEVKKNVSTVKEDIELEVKQRCDKRYPPEDAEKFLDLMKRRFGTYKIGDWVSVLTHHNPEPIEGILQFIGKHYIKVDDTPILISDIKNKLFLIRLNKAECEKRINEEDNRYRIDRTARYESYKEMITPHVTRKVYKDAGYINTDSKNYTGQWFEPKTFVIGAFDLMSEMLIKRKINEGVELNLIGITETATTQSEKVEEPANEPEEVEEVETAEEVEEETEDFDSEDFDDFEF